MDETSSSSLTGSIAASTSTSALSTPSPSASLTPNTPTYFFISPRYRTFTFSAGFLCGQASLILVAVLFLRYVVFEDPTVALREAGKRKKKRIRTSASKRQRRASSSTRKSLFTAAATLPQSDRLILEKLNYDLSTHSSESADWLNVLLAQAIVTYRALIVAKGGQGGRGAKGFVEDAMNSGRGEGEKKEGMVTLDYITVTECDFGEEYPVFTNARVRPSTESGKVRIEVDVDYSDHVSLSMETKVCLNFPKPKFGIIPVSLALALVRFSATLVIEIPPTAFIRPNTANIDSEDYTVPQSRMTMSLHPDFILELASTSLIGSRAKLQDIPKVEQLIISRIRGWVIDNLVWPKVKSVKLPGVVKETPSDTKTTQGVHRKGPVPRDDDDFVFIDEKSSLRSFENGDVATSPDSTSVVDDEDEEFEDEEDFDFEEEDDDEDGSGTAHVNPRMNRQESPVQPRHPTKRRHPQAAERSSSPATSSIAIQATSTALENDAEHEQHSAQHLSHRKISHSSAPSSIPSQAPGLAKAHEEGSHLSIGGKSRQTRQSSLSSTGHNSVVLGDGLWTRSPVSEVPDLQFNPFNNAEVHNGNVQQREGIFRPRTPLHSPGLGLGFAKSGTSSSYNNSSSSLAQPVHLLHQPSLLSRNSSATNLHKSTGSIGSNSTIVAPQNYHHGLNTHLSPRDRQHVMPSTGVFDTSEPRWEAARRAARERKNSPINDALVEHK